MSAAPLPPLTLVLGGARSGKSAFAERLAEENGGPLYLATAEPLDDEMSDRIGRHRARRGPAWKTVEAPLALVPALAAHAGTGRTVVVDCLTLWLSNLLAAGRDLDNETGHLLESLPALEGVVIFVSNEVGLGIVPESARVRRYVDALGRLHQALAEHADRVYFLVAGIASLIKSNVGSEGR